MLFITKKGEFMQGIEVGIDEVLLSREKRVTIQNEMIKKYKLPIISFTMNIPGPIKTNNEIKKVCLGDIEIVLQGYYGQMLLSFLQYVKYTGVGELKEYGFGEIIITNE